jgi:hypothetical protein
MERCVVSEASGILAEGICDVTPKDTVEFVVGVLNLQVATAMPMASVEELSTP